MEPLSTEFQLSDLHYYRIKEWHTVPQNLVKNLHRPISDCTDMAPLDYSSEGFTYKLELHFSTYTWTVSSDSLSHSDFTIFNSINYVKHLHFSPYTLYICRNYLDTNFFFQKSGQAMHINTFNPLNFIGNCYFLNEKWWNIFPLIYLFFLFILLNFLYKNR